MQKKHRMNKLEVNGTGDRQGVGGKRLERRGEVGMGSYTSVNTYISTLRTLQNIVFTFPSHTQNTHTENQPGCRKNTNTTKEI